MSYIGRGLQSGAFRQLDSIESSFDGSTTGFTMQVNSTNVIMGDANQILLSLGGVIQKPGTDFTISSSTLTFTTAPAANTSFFAILLGSDNGGTVTPTDGSVTGDKVASTGAFTIGAAGTASSLAGIPFYNGDTTSIYTHDVSGTDSTATHNTAYGITAMDAITTGDANTAIGWSAGSALNTGTQNTIVGKGALASASSAGSNTAIGWNAAYAVTTGTTAITAIGDGAYNSAGDTEAHNIAIGVNAMAAGSLAGAEYNVAVGNYTLDALTSGDDNVAMGYQAGTAINSGSKNTCIGKGAGGALTTGDENTILGREAQAAAVDSDNSVTLGSSNISSLRCQVQSISALSDERDKTDIIDLPYGLDFINSTRPVQFKWNIRDKYCLENNPHQGKTRNGFIAQELLLIGNNEQHNLVLEDNPDRLEAAYSGMIPMLVKAVQELSAKVKELESK